MATDLLLNLALQRGSLRHLLNWIQMALLSSTRSVQSLIKLDEFSAVNVTELGDERNASDRESLDIYFEAEEDPKSKNQETQTKLLEEEQNKHISQKISQADKEIQEMESLITQSETQISKLEEHLSETAKWLSKTKSEIAGIKERKMGDAEGKQKISGSDSGWKSPSLRQNGKSRKNKLCKLGRKASNCTFFFFRST